MYEDMSSSQEREAGFQAKIRKLWMELAEAECMRNEELERRKEARRSKGSDEDVQEIRKPGDQTAGSDKEGNGETNVRKNWEGREMRVRVEERKRGGRQYLKARSKRRLVDGYEREKRVRT